MIIDYYIVTSFILITSFQTLPRSGLTAAGSWKLSFRERIDCDSSTGHPYVPEKHLFKCPFQEAKTENEGQKWAGTFRWHRESVGQIGEVKAYTRRALLRELKEQPLNCLRICLTM